MTKSHEIYTQLPDEVFKVQKKKRKKLAETSAKDTFGNNKQVKLQCARCLGEEDVCGAMMLIQTRSRGRKERKDNCTNGETTDYSSTTPDKI